MRPVLLLALLLITFLPLTACSRAAPDPLPASGSVRPVTGRDLRIVSGQQVYVPAYAEIFHGREGQNLPLAVTLAIHNTDLDAPIFIQSVRYYDTDGALVRDFVTETLELAPLATTGFLVPDDAASGGWGANFIVEWAAEEPVHEPVIEALMVSTAGTQGLSLISPGRVLSQTGLEGGSGADEQP